MAVYFLGLGVLLLLMKYFAVSVVATWDWWWVLSPFGLAVAWWSFADWSGYTKKKASQREEERRLERIDRTRQALGPAGKKKR